MNNTKQNVVLPSGHRALCRTCALRQHCLPSVLGDQEITQLENIVEQGDVLKKNQTLHHEGQEFTHLHIIRSGSAKTITRSKDSIGQITGLFFTSEIIGLDSIGLQQHPNSTIATETTFICSIRYENLRQLGRLFPDLQDHLIKRLARKIGQGQEQILANSRVTAIERVSLFLLFISKRYQRLMQAENHFRLPMSRVDIGNYLSLSPETVSRSLTRLEKNKIIEIKNKDVKITNLSALNGKIEHLRMI